MGVGCTRAGLPRSPNISSSLPESSSSKAFSRSPKSKSPGVSEREGGKFDAGEEMRWPWLDAELKSSRSHKVFALDGRGGRGSSEGIGWETKSSIPKSSFDGLGAGVVVEPKIQSSSTSGVAGLCCCDDEKEAPPARESSPAQADDVCSGMGGCWITRALALAACSAMLRLALLGLAPNDPESRSPNASPEVLVAAPPFDF